MIGEFDSHVFDEAQMRLLMSLDRLGMLSRNQQDELANLRNGLRNGAENEMQSAVETDRLRHSTRSSNNHGMDGMVR